MFDVPISICAAAVLAITGTAIIIKEIFKVDGMYAGALAFNFVIINSVLILKISEMEMLEMELVMIMHTIIINHLGIIIDIMIKILMIVVVTLHMGGIEIRMGTNIVTFLSSIIWLLTKIRMEIEMTESNTAYMLVLCILILILCAVELLITMLQQPLPPIRTLSPLLLLTKLARLLLW